MKDPGLDQDFQLKGQNLESEPPALYLFSKKSKEKHESKNWSEGVRTYGGAPTSANTYSVISEVRYQETSELYVSFQKGHQL